MEIDDSKYGDAIVLRPKERIDQNSADAFQAALLAVIESGAKAVIVDFSDVEYISSVGLRALMLAAKASKAQGGVLAVAAYAAEVGEIFQIARFGFVVKLFDDLDDAVQAVLALSDDA